MSEYWVSKKKYFCKYCDIYIADDAPSRQQHENGLRHKGNVERFIRGIYKAGEKHKKDLEEEKRDMKRVEQAAAAAFAQDVGAGLAKASSGPVASTSAVPKKPVKPSSPFANYSTAASLGYTDPDAERLTAELELRRSQGIAGEWQNVTRPQPPVGASSSSKSPHPVGSSIEIIEIGIKREAEAPLDEEDPRSFKFRKKILNAGLGETYDPGSIPIKIKKREEPEDLKPAMAGGRSTSDSQTTGVLKWSSVQWKRPEGSSTTNANGAVKTEEEPPTTADIESGQTKWAKPQWSEPLPNLKQEDRTTIFGNQQEEEAKAVGEAKADIKSETDVDDQIPPTPMSESTFSSGSMFKKRKAPVNAMRGRRQT